MPVEQFLLAVALFLLASVFASKASGRLGVPVLILFLGLGMLAGSEGIGGIYFDDAALSRDLGIVALVFILFAGGLETEWSAVRSVIAPASSLATIGVLVTAVVVGWAAHLAAGLSLLNGMLLGAIVSSTDAAAVFSILRSAGVRLRRDAGALLEVESGSNDPMAVFLTTAVLQLLQAPDKSVWWLVLDFVKEMTFGAAIGILFGLAAIRMINGSRLEVRGLYPVMSIAIVLLTYGVTSVIGGSGFLAVYLLGITMARGRFAQRRPLTQFHDAIAWLMQIAMFITLGLLVFPSHLLPVAGASIVIALVLMFVARPLAVFISLASSRLSIRERALIAWIGLRGAVPIILATFPLVAGVPAAKPIFNIVFFVVFASVLLQGTTIATVARWLKVETNADAVASPAAEAGTDRS